MYIFIILAVVIGTYLVLLKKFKTISNLYLIATLLIVCNYFFNIPFKQKVDVLFAPVKYHRYVIENQRYDFILPPKTTMRYRTSDTNAIYLTKSTVDEISDFYKSKTNKFVINQVNNGKTKLLFELQDKIVCMTIEEDTNICILNVEIIIL